MFSTLSFYNESWQRIAIKIELPETKSWINYSKITTSDIEASWIETLLDKKYYSMKFNDSNELDVRNNVLSTLSVADRKLAEPYFIDKSIQIQF
jgi:myo-inositol-1-phosphate synthase